MAAIGRSFQTYVWPLLARKPPVDARRLGLSAYDRSRASSGRSHQWDEFLLSGRPVIAWMPVRGCGFM
jgi:hypothetical protein